MLKETKTQLIPMDSSGSREKVKMCRYNEGIIRQQAYKLPKEEYKNQNKGFKYLLEQLPLLEKKENSNGGYSYKASKNFNDDFAMVFFMLGYALNYLKESMNEGKEFKLGNYTHRLYLRKYQQQPQEETILPTTYMTIL